MIGIVDGAAAAKAALDAAKKPRRVLEASIIRGKLLVAALYIGLHPIALRHNDPDEHTALLAAIQKAFAIEQEFLVSSWQ